MSLDKMDVFIVSVKSPPLGGATIYVDRLCEQLDDNHIAYYFFDVRKDSIFKFFRLTFKSKLVHIIVSNPIYRLCLIIYSRIFWKTIIVTYVGDIGRFGGWKNCLEACSIRMCDTPVVLNTSSLEKALKHNKNALKLSSFIPPPLDEGDYEENLAIYAKFEGKYNKILCTNASHYTVFSLNGKELYGIGDLVDLFRSELEEYALIISDPSGEYSLYFNKSGITLPPNVVLSNKGYKFTTLMKICDGVIRNTQTDGDSLTVKEALYFQKPIFASDCVDRPAKVIIFETGNMLDLKNKILSFDFSIINRENPINGAIECIELYKMSKK